MPTERCGAKTRKGTLCKNRAGFKTEHVGVGKCHLHGGSEPHAQVNGLVLLARREQQIMGAPLSIEPQDAILECIRIAAGEVAYASERIAALQAEDAAGPVRYSMVRKTGEETVQEVRQGEPRLHIWIEARRSAMDRLVQYSVAALKAGIAQQLVEISKAQAGLIAQGFRTLVVALGHDPDAPEVRQALRAQLTVLSGGAA